MAKPISKNTIDNERNKFQEDANGDVAVNVISQQLQDVIDAINASTVVTKNTPTIHNINIATAGVEQSLALGTNVKSFLIRSVRTEELQLAYVSTESSTNFITINKRAVYEETGLNVSGLTLYFQSDTDNTDIEIIEWS